MKLFESVARLSLLGLAVATVPALAAPEEPAAVSIEDPRVGRCSENELQSVTLYFNEHPEECAAYECLEQQTAAFVTKLNNEYTDLHTAEEVNQLANMFAACYCRCELMKCEIDFFVENGTTECRAATRDYCEASDEKFIDRCTAAAKARPQVYDLEKDEAGFKQPCTVCGTVVESPDAAFPTGVDTPSAITVQPVSTAQPAITVQPVSEDPFNNVPQDLSEESTFGMGTEDTFPTVSESILEGEAATTPTEGERQQIDPEFFDSVSEGPEDVSEPPAAAAFTTEPTSEVFEGTVVPVATETSGVPVEIKDEKPTLSVESSPPRDQGSLDFLQPSPPAAVLTSVDETPSDATTPTVEDGAEPEESSPSVVDSTATVDDAPVEEEAPSPEPTVPAPVVTEQVGEEVPPTAAPTAQTTDEAEVDNSQESAAQELRPGVSGVLFLLCAIGTVIVAP